MENEQRALHLVYIPFTGVGINGGYRGDDWFVKRIEIFKKYTLSSLENQTSQAFVLWLSFRAEEKENPQVAELSKYMQEKKLRFVLTFDGLMYWDDKFNTDLKSQILNCARVVRQMMRERKALPVFEVFKNKNKTLRNRMGNSLNVLQKVFERMDWIYLTRIDSDDMFRNDTLENIEKISPFKGAVCAKNGFVYNSLTDEIAEWRPTTNPPFHTIIFPAEDFFSASKHIAYYKGYKSHEDITKLFDCKFIEDGSYCVVIHGNHVSTVWNHPFRGSKVDNFILESFYGKRVS